MTSKRLLNDVSILKEEKEGNARKNPLRGSADSDSDSEIGGNTKHTRNKRRDTTSSARLSYSSTSTSSSAESFLTFPGPMSSIDNIHGSDTNALASQSSADYLIAENIPEKSSQTSQEASQEETILKKGEESYGPLPYDARRISLLESDQSPVNTSFESELTPADSNNASFNSSSSSSSSSSNNSNSNGNSAWSGKVSDIYDTTVRRSKRIKVTSSI